MTSIAKPEKRMSPFMRGFQKSKYVYLMFLPIAIYYIVFAYMPMYGIVIAFQDYQPGMSFFEGADFIGFKNFRELFSSPMFPRLIRNTILLNVWSLCIGFPAPILLALLLNELRSNKFKRTVQTITYMPHFIALVVVMGILKDMLSSEGLFNTLGKMIYVHLQGGDPSNYRPTLFLNIPEYFRPIYTLSGVWQGVGWGSIIYLSSLSSIDPQLYDAASIDGAGRFRKIISVTLPGIAPTIIIQLIFAVGGLMSSGFEKTILLYQPLTYEVADTLGTYVYRKGLEEARYSFSTAVDLFSTIINFMLVITVNKISRTVSETSLW